MGKPVVPARPLAPLLRRLTGVATRSRKARDLRMELRAPTHANHRRRRPPRRRARHRVAQWPRPASRSRREARRAASVARGARGRAADPRDQGRRDPVVPERAGPARPKDAADAPAAPDPRGAGGVLRGATRGSRRRPIATRALAWRATIGSCCWWASWRRTSTTGASRSTSATRAAGGRGRPWPPCERWALARPRTCWKRPWRPTRRRPSGRPSTIASPPDGRTSPSSPRVASGSHGMMEGKTSPVPCIDP